MLFSKTLWFIGNIIIIVKILATVRLFDRFIFIGIVDFILDKVKMKEKKLFLDEIKNQTIDETSIKLLGKPFVRFQCWVQFASENPWPKRRQSPVRAMLLCNSMPALLKIKTICQTLNPLYFPDVRNRNVSSHATDLSTLQLEICQMSVQSKCVLCVRAKTNTAAELGKQINKQTNGSLFLERRKINN